MAFINDFFDEVWCINLDRRTDRWAEVQPEFQRCGIQAKRSSAVDGKTLPVHPEQIVSANEMGCTRSHLNLIEDMLTRNLKRIMIFEDDVYFTGDPNTRLEGVVQYMPKQWDMVYLGGNHVRPLIKSGPIWKCTRTFTTSAYGITREFGERILKEYRPDQRQIDVIYANTHMRGNSFAVSPGCCGQKAGYSDIQNAHVDYSKFF